MTKNAHLTTPRANRNKTTHSPIFNHNDTQKNTIQDPMVTPNIAVQVSHRLLETIRHFRSGLRDKEGRGPSTIPNRPVKGVKGLELQSVRKNMYKVTISQYKVGRVEK